jgi:NADH-quinone oxidoreductase subunit M
MVYDRAHTRELEVLQGLHLSRALPFAAVTFVIASAASMGLPGFSGFVAELQVLIGAWHAFPVLAVLAAVGILIGVAYTLRAMQQAFFGDAPAGREPGPGLEPITVAERLGAALLIAATLGIGVYPPLLLDYIDPSVAVVLEQMQRGGGW